MIDELDASGKHARDTWPDPIIDLVLKVDHVSTWASIRFVGDGFVLHWTDGVTGDWEETYPRLDVAVVRLATLMHCGSTDWWKGFTTAEPAFFHDAAEFVEMCDDFFGRHTT